VKVRACSGDANTLCPFGEGDARVPGCLEQNMAALSAKCAEAHQTPKSPKKDDGSATAKHESTQPARHATAAACDGDKKRLCASVKVRRCSSSVNDCAPQ
jgi:hypothetical protein